MSEYRIIITGGRKRESEDDYATLEDILDYCDPHGFVDNRAAIIQGGCPDGADLLARKAAERYGLRVETCPADFDSHPDDAVEVSNQAMVDRGADLCIAMPNAPADGPSLGTWDMIRRAVDAGIETLIYPEAGHERQ